MTSLGKLARLQTLIDAAMQLANELDESMMVYLLSIARLEVSEKIDHLASAEPVEIDED